jgi:hypothetical protein
VQVAIALQFGERPTLRVSTILQCAAEGRADFANQRQIDCQGLIEPFQDGHPPLALENAADQVGGEGTKHH